MRTHAAIAFAIAIILGVLPVLGQVETGEDLGRLTPTRDPSSPTGVLIPEDLDGALEELNHMLHPELIAEMKAGSEEDMAMHHFGLGMWIRNNWGLWGESRLQSYFRDLGVLHPDDMSGIILDSYWRSLNGRPILLDEQVAYYKEYWDHNSHPEDLTCPEHSAPVEIDSTRSVSDGPDGMRVLHWGKCEVGGETWVYELRKGLYEPDEETRRLIEN